MTKTAKTARLLSKNSRNTVHNYLPELSIKSGRLTQSKSRGRLLYSQKLFYQTVSDKTAIPIFLLRFTPKRFAIKFSRRVIPGCRNYSTIFYRIFHCRNRLSFKHYAFFRPVLRPNRVRRRACRFLFAAGKPRLAARVFQRNRNYVFKERSYGIPL